MKTSRSLWMVLLLALAWSPALALDLRPKDDQVTFTLSAEEWVTTETARVILGVEAAVSENTAGSMRRDMLRAVNAVVKADWRLTGFNRMQDATGLERWSASFEARLPEAVLSGLNDQAKKNSKAGMQIAVMNIDFSPTLGEKQAIMSKLRTQIYKLAAEQLTELNTALPDRSFRIASIDFLQPGQMPPSPVNRSMGKTLMSAQVMMDSSAEMGSMERSEKMVMTAQITLASTTK